MSILTLILGLVIIWLMWDEFVRKSPQRQVKAPAPIPGVADVATAEKAVAAVPAEIVEQTGAAALSMLGRAEESGVAGAVAVHTEVEEAVTAVAHLHEEGAAAPTEAMPSAPVEAVRAPTATPELGYPDDLTEIKGIGKVYQERLFAGGMFTYDQVANADVETLQKVTDAIDATNFADWPRQAGILAEKLGRVGARYSGPVPDDFTELEGVGAASRMALYQGGIYTFAQLAAAAPEEVAEILAGSAGEGMDQIEQVIAQATQQVSGA